MKVFKREIEFPCTIYLIGDVHVGDKAFRESEFKRLVGKIREDDNASWIGMGDYIDAIGINDKRFDLKDMPDFIGVNDLDDLPRIQADEFHSLTHTISDKCLGMLCGNHEETVAKHNSFNVYRYLCRLMGAEELGYTSWMQVGNKSKIYDIYLTHGFGGGRMVGSKANNISRLLDDNFVDVAAMGHVHDPLVISSAKRYTRRGRLRVKNQIGIISGTFLGSSNYALDRGFSPAKLNQIAIDVDERSLKASCIEP